MPARLRDRPSRPPLPPAGDFAHGGASCGVAVGESGDEGAEVGGSDEPAAPDSHGTKLASADEVEQSGATDRHPVADLGQVEQSVGVGGRCGVVHWAPSGSHRFGADRRTLHLVPDTYHPHTSPDRARRDVETSLGRSVSDEAWAALVLGEQVDEYLSQGAYDVGDLAGEVKRFEEILRAEKENRAEVRRSRPAANAVEGDRAWAMSMLYVREARQKPAVVAFRREVLGGDLLDYDAVVPWVGRQAKLDGKFSAVFKIEALPAKTTVPDEMPRPGPRLSESFGTYGELRYAGPDDDHVRIVNVARNGVLDRLRLIAEDLANLFRWDVASAVSFVLSDGVPLIPTFTYGYRGFNISDGWGYPSTSRIHLEIDPATSPTEVATLYGQLRAHLRGSRVRPMSQRTYRMVAVAAAYPERSWRRRRDAWQHLHPGEEQVEVDTYRRTVQRAEAKLWAGPGPGQIVNLPSLLRGPAE